jgi:competence CoiA-like predicted nuclease
MKLKLPFGLKDNKLVDATQVERGAKCGCSCPACGHPLIARKGNKKINHFAHIKSPECANAVETALHLAA